MEPMQAHALHAAHAGTHALLHDWNPSRSWGNCKTKACAVHIAAVLEGTHSVQWLWRGTLPTTCTTPCTQGRSCV